jgi:choloylglycine hydrolase
VKHKISIVTLFLMCILPTTSIQQSLACTDFLVKTTDGANIVGRSMEWGQDLKSHVWLYPRGQSHASQTPAGKSGLTWKSKYGYLALNCYDQPLAVDGMNEKGLSIGSLWLPGTIYQDVPANNPEVALSALDLGHWLLGNFTTVSEVTSAISKVKVWSPQLAEWGGTPTMHLAIHDAQGNSAVIEFVDGQQKIYANPGTVLTNAPTFDWHMTNLNNYIRVSADNAQPVSVRGTILAPPGQGGGFLGIPGDWTPPSRFIRTTAMLAFAKPASSATSGVNLALHILNAVDIPLGDVRPKAGEIEHSDYTQWIVIKDLTNSMLYFRSYDNLNLRALDLKKLDFSENKPAQDLAAVSGGSPVIDITLIQL